jgi:Ca2+/Na+ antiporter
MHPCQIEREERRYVCENKQSGFKMGMRFIDMRVTLVSILIILIILVFILNLLLLLFLFLFPLFVFFFLLSTRNKREQALIKQERNAECSRQEANTSLRNNNANYKIGCTLLYTCIKNKTQNIRIK